MVCKLNTRCSVVAACNPQSSFDDSIEGVTANVAIASPLLSRFDLIFMLSDHGRGEDWDARLAEEILGKEGEGVEVAETEEEAIDVSRAESCPLLTHTPSCSWLPLSLPLETKIQSYPKLPL